MAECRKGQGLELDGDDYSPKRHRVPPELPLDDAGEDILALLSIDDDTVAELMKLLEIETTSVSKVKFIDDPYSSLPVIFQSYSSYVTINGNEESCGSSFSDLESSVMASVDMVGSSLKVFERFDGGACYRNEEGGRGELGEGEVLTQVREMDGRDGFDWDVDLLLRFLGD